MTDPRQISLWCRESEAAVAGHLLAAEGDAAEEIADEIFSLTEVDDFHEADVRATLEAVFALRGAGERLDVARVAKHIRQGGTAHRFACSTEGVSLSLLNLIEDAASIKLAVALNIVLEAKRRRELYRIGDVLRGRAYTEVGDPVEFAEGAMAELQKVAGVDAGTTDHATEVDTARLAFLAECEGNSPSSLGAPTGLPDLDALLRSGGLPRKSLTVIAGRPSMGKSTLAMNIAVHAAENDRPVLVFSLEESREAWLIRAASHRAKIHVGDPRYLSGPQKDALNNAYKKLAALPLQIVESTADVTPTEISRVSRQFRAKHGSVALVIADYLDLIKMPKAERRDLAIGEVTRVLKQLAMKLDTAFVLVCQLNRQVEGREDHEPRLSDLRNSGAIEQDADVAIFVHRPGYFDPKGQPQDETRRRLARAIVAKQRSGAVGAVDLAFFGETYSFRDFGAIGSHGPSKGAP